MTRSEFAAWCGQSVRLLDGATGSNLYRAGMPRGVCSEAWIADHPEVILALQEAYVRAGSQIVYAPTFCANRVSLSSFGLEDRLEALNRQLVALTRKAVGENALVAGDMTTLGRPVEEEGPYSYPALLEVYRQQAQVLEEAGVDLYVIETMMGVEETLAALEAVRAVSHKPVMVTMSVQSDGKCYFDGTIFQAASAVEALGADAVGVNCASGPDQLVSVIRGLKEVCGLPLIAKPNAGIPRMTDAGEAVYDMPPAAFAKHMQALAEAGAQILGGCCGTTPEYIAALKAALK